jgi:hypothetical protein
MSATREQIQAVFDVMVAITELIRTKGEIPSGELYAAVMSKLDIHTYEAILSRIKGSGLVVEKNHLLVWVGPRNLS